MPRAAHPYPQAVASAHTSEAIPESLRPPAIAWRWSSALFGALCALPAVVVATQDPSAGLALAIGALAPAAVGISATRRRRVASLLVGIAIGLGLVVGAALSWSWWLAVAGIFVLCVAAAAATTRARIGSLVLMLAVPMVGAGLSFGGDVRRAFDAAVLIAVGAACGGLLSLIWPEPPATPRAAAARPDLADMIEYGVRLGSAGALCAGIGFALALDHPGWATAACLLVMRPSAEMTRLRGAGRAISVTAGALGAALLAASGAEPVVMAIAIGVALTCLAATRESRWYVTGGFTTFLVISLLVYGMPGQAETRLIERVAETLLGVGIALLFGIAIPRARRRDAS